MLNADEKPVIFCFFGTVYCTAIEPCARQHGEPVCREGEEAGFKNLNPYYYLLEK